MTNEELIKLKDEAWRGFHCGQNLLIELLDNLSIAIEALEHARDIACPCGSGDIAREALAKIRGEEK
jgi:hypothetical protein